MIRETTGDIFTANVEALVNPVNTVGVMGAGLALQFKRKYPEVFEEYSLMCRGGGFDIGHVLVHEADDPPRRHVISFPTKRHWSQPSKLEWIDSGLIDLRWWIGKLVIRSIAVPPLGCGLGGLDWADVRGLIEERLGELPDVDVVLYVPR